MLLRPRALLHATLVGRKQFPPLARLGIRRPDLDRETAQIDPCDLRRVELVIGQIAFADLPRAMTLEDDDLATDRLESLGDRESVGAGFDDQDVRARRVTLRPGDERLQRLAG